MELFQVSSRLLIMVTSLICGVLWLFSLIVTCVLRIVTKGMTRERARERYDNWFPKVFVENMGNCIKSLKWLHIVCILIIAAMWAFGTQREQAELLTMILLFGKICVWTIAGMFLFSTVISLVCGKNGESVSGISKIVHQQLLPMSLIAVVYCVINWFIA